MQKCVKYNILYIYIEINISIYHIYIHIQRIEALKARVSTLEREISECAACNGEEHRPPKGKGNNGPSKGKGSSSKKSGFFNGFTNPRRKFFY